MIVGWATAGLLVAQARDLPQILRAVVSEDAQVREAQANERVAAAVLKRSESTYYPTIRASVNQPLANSNEDRRSFTPGVEASWRVYDFGQTSAHVERDKIKTEYYRFKTEETAEELAYSFTKDYLEALQAKMSLEVARRNLARHQRIVGQTRIIMEYDPGRRSEYTQAHARQIQVEESIISYERTLGLALQRMVRYINPPVTMAELENPFAKLPIGELLARFPQENIDALEHPTYIAQLRELRSIEANVKAAERSRYPAIEVQAQANKYDSSVYLTMAVDVLNRKTGADIDEQRFQAQAAQARLTQIAQSLEQRAKVAELQMREDQSRIEIAQVQAKSMAQVAQDYEDQFKIATKSLLDVVNAYSELSNVEQLKVRAEYDLMLAKLDYLSAAGAISEWAGIPKQSVHEDIIAEREAETPFSLDSIVEFEEGGGDVIVSTVSDKKSASKSASKPEFTADHTPAAVFRVNDQGELLLEAASSGN